MEIDKILAVIRPNSPYVLQGDEYSGLTWMDPQTEKPTLEELEAAWPTVSMQLTNEEARRNRLAAFRDEADPLFFGWQRGENTEQAWLDKCEEIRQRFPYVTA